MRYALCAAAVFFLASVGIGNDAQAQISYSGEGGCNKGMFWPFVRSPGDCLTDVERRSGMSGTYRESEVQEQESGAAAPASEATVSNPTAPTSASPSSTSPATAAMPAASTIQPAAARPGQTVEPTAAQNPNAEDRATYTGQGGCTKGVFWPFVRRPGDCLTNVEIRSGQTGTYQ